MLFSSPTFLVFFVIYFAFHLVVPRKYSVYLIICGSTVFYAWWKLAYVWLPFLLMAIAYGGVLWINRTAEPTSRRRRMIAAIVLLFVPLVVFKYTNFIYLDVLGPLFGFRERLLDLSLPLGVSFVTFTLTAFIVDVYSGRFPLVKSPATVLAYVLFFPHLIAGPILRPVELIPQLQHPRAARVLFPTVAIAIFTLGLVKKLVLADVIGESVDAVYLADHPSGPAAVLAILGFSAQIYCDFSGYTDMAIGLAMLLGVRLPNNFRQPYAASSLVDFWRRWHMTLSFWLRDYLYIPLGGNRGGLLRAGRNIIVTMTLGGLWHGASWTFVLWGLTHGIGIASIHALRGLGSNAVRAIPAWVAAVLTFGFVTLAWVLFRAPNLAKAGDVLRAAAFGGGWDGLPDFAAANVFPLFLLLLFYASHPFDDHRRVKVAVRRYRVELIWPVIAFGWIIAVALSQGNSAKFIYFDF
jgi:alginate O-acetyltransferase complex protein AlgI